MDANIGRSHAVLIGLLPFALAIVTGGLPYSFWVISHLTLIKPLTSGEPMSTYWVALLQQSHWHQENRGVLLFISLIVVVVLLVAATSKTL
jgi:hypothetical protein